MVAYLDTHPWLTFQFDLVGANPRVWVLMGAAQADVNHLIWAPLKPSVAADLHRLYLAKGVHATTAIEGNPLSEDQTGRVLAGSLKLPKSQEYLERELRNIVEGIDLIMSIVAAEQRFVITPERIDALNLRVLEGLELEEGVVPGEIRQHSVTVGRYLGAPWEQCEELVAELCRWLNGRDFERVDGDEVTTFLRAMCRAVAAHLYMAWIHPFGDGNGRTARLLEFGILLASGFPTLACHLLSNHYNLTRNEYYRQLDQASGSGGDIKPFLEYALQGFVDQLDEALETVRQQNLESAWQNFVHERFDGQNGLPATRQCALVLELSSQPAPVPKSRLASLSPWLAAAYAGRGEKTLSRDVNALLRMELVERTDVGYRARTEIIQGFLPGRLEV